MTCRKIMLGFSMYCPSCCARKFSRLAAREIGAETMTRATFFTDNCGKQFKCMIHLGWSGERRREGTRQGWRRYPAERPPRPPLRRCVPWKKHISDSEGGVTKTHARRGTSPTCMSWRVESSRDLVRQARQRSQLHVEGTYARRARYLRVGPGTRQRDRTSTDDQGE